MFPKELALPMSVLISTSGKILMAVLATLVAVSATMPVGVRIEFTAK